MEIRFTLDRLHRLTSSKDWKEVRTRGRCSRSSFATICVLFEGESEKFGFAAAKSIGSVAKRNRAKRRLREAFRQTYKFGSKPCLVIAIAGPECLTMDFQELKSKLAQQLSDLGLPIS